MKELFSICNTDRLSSIDKIGCIYYTLLFYYSIIEIVINDIFALSVCGKITINECLDLIKMYIFILSIYRFKNEKNMGIWSEIYHHLNGLLNLYNEESFYPKLQKYVIDLFLNKYNEIGWYKSSENEIQTTNLFRCQIIRIMIKCGYKEAIEKAKSVYYTTIKEGKYINADIKSICYKSILNEDEYEVAERNYNDLYNQLKDLKLSEEKKRILSALGQSKHEKLIERTLELSINAKTRIQDINFIISSCSSNPKGKNMSWLFFKNHYDYYYKILDTGTMFSNCVSHFISGMRSECELKDIKEFFMHKDTKRYIRKLNNGIETVYIIININININLMKYKN